MWGWLSAPISSSCFKRNKLPHWVRRVASRNQDLMRKTEITFPTLPFKPSSDGLGPELNPQLLTCLTWSLIAPLSYVLPPNTICSGSCCPLLSRQASQLCCLSWHLGLSCLTFSYLQCLIVPCSEASSGHLTKEPLPHSRCIPPITSATLSPAIIGVSVCLFLICFPKQAGRCLEWGLCCPLHTPHPRNIAQDTIVPLHILTL